MLRGIFKQKQTLSVLKVAAGKYGSSRPASTYPREIVSFTDPKWFPTETGPIQSSPYASELEVPKCRIDQFIWENVSQWQDKTAVACGITGRSYTYAKLRDNCAALAVNLQRFGLRKDDVVGVCMPNAPEFMLSVLGILEAGCIVTPCNPAYTADEIARQIEGSRAKLMICAVDNVETVRKAIEITKKDIKIVCAGDGAHGAIKLSDWITGVDYSDLKTYDFDPEDIGVLPYSSGTTGLPKGVMMRHFNYIANGVMFEKNKAGMTMPTTAEQQEVLLCILPLFHAFAFNAIFVSKLTLGAKVVTLPTFKPDTFVRAISEHKTTFLNLVPPLILFLGQAEMVKPSHLSAVRRIVSGGAPLGVADAEAVFRKTPNVIFGQGFGMTETSCLAIFSPSDRTELASPGYPAGATQVKIVALDDPEMKALGPNESGEIFVRGPQNMKGYLNNEEATKETLVANNWLRTGDIGYYDDEGKFYVTDRLKELIKVKGFQVAPAELEAHLRSHPSIAEAAVVGAPHKVSGEVPRAFVVAKPNQTVNEEEIKKFLAEKVAKFKMPDSIVVVDAIPKNASGKIMRRQVKIKYGLV